MHADPIKELRQAIPASYERLITQMKFYIEPEISCSRFFGNACFTEKSIAAYRASHDITALELSELGSFVAEHLKEGLFIDIPCGLHAVREQNTDFDVTDLACALGAQAVWEVDLSRDVIRDRVPETIVVLENRRYALMHGIGAVGRRIVHDVEVLTMQDDLLGFISKMPAGLAPKAIYISAIQPNAEFVKSEQSQRDIAFPYLEALYNELARVSEKNDLLILNSSAMLAQGLSETLFPNVHPALALPARGFSLMRRCAFDKVHVFRKD
jgi:hypothetical protein